MTNREGCLFRDFEAEDDDRLSELPGSSRGNKSLSNLLNLPETLRKRSSCMVDSLELGTPLGRGSYGKVYKGEPPDIFWTCCCT